MNRVKCICAIIIITIFKDIITIPLTMAMQLEFHSCLRYATMYR